MDDHTGPDRGLVAALLDRAVTADTTDRSRLLALSARCWPGRDDRTLPAGRHWIRAWGPRPMTAVPHDCSRAAVCHICN
jgi:hypothetical protein